MARYTTGLHADFIVTKMGLGVQGVMRADPKSTQVADDVVRLWLHECDRVFADRLVNDEDRQWLLDAQGNLTSSMFSRTYGEVVTTERLVFGDFMIPSASSATAGHHLPLVPTPCGRVQALLFDLFSIPSPALHMRPREVQPLPVPICRHRECMQTRSRSSTPKSPRPQNSSARSRSTSRTSTRCRRPRCAS